MGQGSFHQAKFERGSIDFTDVSFLDDVVFTHAKFSGTAAFSGARFAKRGDFMRASFNVEAYFRKAKFIDGLAHFPGAVFCGVADFGDARFGKDGAYFPGVTFYGSATFDEAQSAGDADYRDAKFNGEASFERSQFLDLIAFNDAKFKSAAVFKGSTYESVPTFHGAKLHEDTSFENVTWPKRIHKKQSPYDAARAWGRLRVEMSRLHKHEDELFFFERELNARAQDRLNEALAKRLLYRTYLALGAGRNVLAPFGWMIGLNVLLYLPIYWYGTFALQGRSVSIWDMLRDAATFNIPADVVSFWLGLALPFIGGFNPARADLYRRLFAGAGSTEIDVPLWLQLVAMSQQFVGIVLLFMIGLALRNRFRMK